LSCFVRLSSRIGLQWCISHGVFFLFFVDLVY
jgi:hypothetical protein